MSELTLGPDDLRALVRTVVRDALKDSLPDVVAGAAQAASAAVAGQRAGVDEGAEPVVVRTDADLDAFVRRLLVIFDSPRQRSDLRAGRLRFRLSDGVSAAPAVPAGAATRVDKGAVSERMVKAAAASGSRLILGRRAVMTPLASDKARLLGVTIEREA